MKKIIKQISTYKTFSLAGLPVVWFDSTGGTNLKSWSFVTPAMNKKQS